MVDGASGKSTTVTDTVLDLWKGDSVNAWKLLGRTFCP